MHEIKSIEIFQTAKVIAALYTITAAIFGVFVAFMSLLHGHPGRAIMAIIFFPILYGIVSFIGTAFFCWLRPRTRRPPIDLLLRTAPVASPYLSHLTLRSSALGHGLHSTGAGGPPLSPV